MHHSFWINEVHIYEGSALLLPFHPSVMGWGNHNGACYKRGVLVFLWLVAGTVHASLLLLRKMMSPAASSCHIAWDFGRSLSLGADNAMELWIVSTVSNKYLPMESWRTNDVMCFRVKEISDRILMVLLALTQGPWENLPTLESCLMSAESIYLKCF